MMDTIKSYLISLGFDVDKKSYDETKKTISETEKNLSDLAAKSAKHFIAAGAAVSAFMVAANVGIAKLVSNLAAADLQSEMLARQLWTSRDSAESFKKTLDAMGVTLEQLYLSPELASGFRELRSQIEGMRPPPEFRNQMKFIRDIQFEFTRLKLSAQYALQWIGHYLIKNLSGPLNDLKKRMQDFNKQFIEDMPKWTERAARFLTSFVNAGRHLLEFFGDMKERIGSLLDAIPNNVKGVAAAVSGIAMLLSTGPFGMIIAMLTMAILLIDDFYTHMEGGKSALGPMWDKLLEFKDKLSETGDLERLKQSFTGLMDALDEVITSLGKILLTLTGSDSIEEAFDKLAKISFESLLFGLKTLEGVLKSIADILGIIDSIIQGKTGEFLIERGKTAEKELLEEGADFEDRGYWGNIWRDAKEFFNPKDMFTFGGTGSKQIDMGIGAWVEALFPQKKETSSTINNSDANTGGNAIQTSAGVDQIKKLGIDTKVGNKTLDKIADDSKYLSNISSAMNIVAALSTMDFLTKGSYGAMYATYPQSDGSSPQLVTLNQNNNIYGSDPQATADSVVGKTEIILRNTKSWSV
ncbi:hypothetical protein SAMN04487969_102497 [Paenibacillus algorifonticola]|uniref:Uncharacterized protein n=2 Tax=Paenibacillus algorifonticola TaxID=684063 RepID=A0A1I2AKM2_9BACL|nr:hypothetical protein SAMN04487969_102497 [Paenibacillus algorifonticola]